MSEWCLSWFLYLKRNHKVFTSIFVKKSSNCLLKKGLSIKCKLSTFKNNSCFYRKLMKTWIDKKPNSICRICADRRQPVDDLLTDRINYNYQRMTFQNRPSNRKPETEDLYPVTLTLSDVWPLSTRTLGWKPDEWVNNGVSAHMVGVNDFRFRWAIIKDPRLFIRYQEVTPSLELFY